MKKKFVVRPKVTRYKVGKLYEVWFRGGGSNLIYSNPDRRSSTVLGRIKSGDIVIWDDWFSPVKVDQLDQNPSLQKMKEFKKNDNQVIYVLYHCK